MIFAFTQGPSSTGALIHDGTPWIESTPPSDRQNSTLHSMHIMADHLCEVSSNEFELRDVSVESSSC
jgi:hypothetical protein